MAARKKSAARKSAARKAAKRSRPRVAPKKVAKKVAKKKLANKKVAKKIVRRAVVPPGVAPLDQRIAILRENLRAMTEQAAASSGASTEELLSDRINAMETQLRALTAERDALIRRN